MEQLGIFIGTVIGAALKVCGPAIVDIGVAIYRKILLDSAEVGKPNEQLQADWQQRDPDVKE